MKLYYVNMEARTRDVRIAAIGEGPLVYGKAYDVTEGVVAALMASGHWVETAPGSDSPGSDPAHPVDKQQWAELCAAPGIKAELARALDYIGLGTRDLLRAEVEKNGIKTLLQVPGIGSKRAHDLAAWATSEEN